MPSRDWHGGDQRTTFGGSSITAAGHFLHGASQNMRAGHEEWGTGVGGGGTAARYRGSSCILLTAMTIEGARGGRATTKTILLVGTDNSPPIFDATLTFLFPHSDVVALPADAKAAQISKSSDLADVDISLRAMDPICIPKSLLIPSICVVVLLPAMMRRKNNVFHQAEHVVSSSGAANCKCKKKDVSI